MDRKRTESSREGKVKNTEDILQDLGVRDRQRGRMTKEEKGKSGLKNCKHLPCEG